MSSCKIIVAVLFSSLLAMSAFAQQAFARDDVPEELEVVVAEVEEQELALDPVVDDELSAIVDPTVGQLDTGPPAALDAHHGVELGGRRSRGRFLCRRDNTLLGRSSKGINSRPWTKREMYARFLAKFRSTLDKPCQS